MSDINTKVELDSTKIYLNKLNSIINVVDSNATYKVNNSNDYYNFIVKTTFVDTMYLQIKEFHEILGLNIDFTSPRDSIYLTFKIQLAR